MKMLALKKMLMMKVLFAVLLLGSLPALSAAQATKSTSAKPASAKPVSLQGTQPPFLEEFSNADMVASRWEEVTNGGSLTVSDHRLALTGNGGKGFPVLTTRTSPFPASGNWTVSFGYRYTSIGHYGTDLFCSRTSGPELVAVHQDVNNQVITINGKPVSSTPPNTEWHVVSVVKSGPRVTAFLDGKKVGGDDMGMPPASIRLGGCLVDNPWDWNDLEVQFVRVDRGQHPLRLASLTASPAQEALPPQLPLLQAPSIAIPADKPAQAAKMPQKNESNANLDKNNPNLDDNNAGLPETLEWMTRKINASAGYLRQDISMELKYSHAHFRGTDLIYTSEEILPVEDNVSEVTLSLDAIDETTIKYTTDPTEGGESFMISFLTRGGMTAKTSERLAGSTMVKGAALKFASEDDARRFTAALRHAVHLSVQLKPKEPF